MTCCCVVHVYKDMTKILIHEDTSELDHEYTPQTTKSRYNWGDFYMHTLQREVVKKCSFCVLFYWVALGHHLPCVLEKNRVNYCLSKTINNHGYNEGLHEIPLLSLQVFWAAVIFFWQNRGVLIFFLWGTHFQVRH